MLLDHGAKIHFEWLFWATQGISDFQAFVRKVIHFYRCRHVLMGFAG